MLATLQSLLETAEDAAPKEPEVVSCIQGQWKHYHISKAAAKVMWRATCPSSSFCNEELNREWYNL